MKTCLPICLVLTLLHWACNEPPAKKPITLRPAPAKTDTLKQPADLINMVAVGDIMLGTSYPNDKNLPPDSAKQSFKYALTDLKNADITFGNLEGTLLDTGAAVGYKLNFRSKGYLFRMPAYYGGVIKNAGFNLLSLANNHVDDFGKAGRKNTIKVLDSLGIHCAGLLNHPTAAFTIKGVRYGFCAFAPNSQTTPLLNMAFVKNTVRQLKQSCDIVIVSFHGGGEGIPFEHVPCTSEKYAGENRGNVNAFAHAAIDAGADVIFGNGPHVSRALELYNGHLIAYSLGNFCTHKSVSVQGGCGFAPLLKIVLNKKGHFLNGHIVSYIQSHDKGLLPDPRNQAALRIKALTESDFENSGLSISANGTIFPAETN